MSTVTSLGSAGHVPSLAKQLADVAETAGRAATLAKGDYLHQPTMFELQRAFNDAGRAATVLDELGARIALLDGGEQGLRLAKAALAELDAGRAAIKAGASAEDDVLRSGTAVLDAVEIGAAGGHFDAAAQGVRDIAAIARIEETSVDDLLRAIVGDA